jgi:hypothetical protein
MVPQTVVSRVDTLERKMGRLEDLPDRMSALESQIVQFRAEVSVEFSAVRTEMRAMGEELRGEMRTMGDELRGEMRTIADGLRLEMVALNHETVTRIQILHEDVISRIALIDEHRGRKGPRRETSGGRRLKKR